MHELHVRDASPADIGFLVDSNLAMALETEHKQLDRQVLERGVAAVFERAERGFYLIAERAGQPLGCLMITYEWSDWRCGTWWWLQSVFVAAEHRREGVFRALHAEVARRAASQADVVGVRLYVETGNARAQQTYAALGFDTAGYLVLEQPHPAQPARE